MTNVVTFQPRPTPLGKTDLIERLREMENRARVSHANITKCRNGPLAISAYADFLRRYYEMDGAVKSAFNAVDKEVNLHGTAEDPDRIYRLVEYLARVDDYVKGPQPWLSLPSEQRFRDAAMRALGFIVGDLTRAIIIASAIGTKSPEKPKGAA